MAALSVQVVIVVSHICGVVGNAASDTTTTTTISRYFDDSIKRVVSTVLISCVGFICQVLLFTALMNCKRIAPVLVPKLPQNASNKCCEGCYSFLLLIFIAWRKRNQPEHCLTSLDGKVFVHFLEFGFRMCLVGSCMSAVLVYLYQGGSNEQQGFNRFSISNLQFDGDRIHMKGVLSITVLLAYVMMAIAFWQVRMEWRWFVKQKHEHYARFAAFDSQSHPGVAQAMRTLLVEFKHGACNSSADVVAIFDRVFGQTGRVHSCVVQRNTAYLHELIRAGVCELSDGALSTNLGSLREMELPLAESILRREAGSPISAASPTPLITVRGSSRTRRRDAARAMSLSGTKTSTAFVTFWTLRDRIIAEQLRPLLSPLSLEANPIISLANAPEHRDILWGNMSYSIAQVWWRRELVGILLLLGAILWAFPVAFITGVNLPSDIWERYLPDSLMHFLRLHHVYEPMKALFPIGMLVILLTILPHLFRFLARTVERRKTKTEVERVVLRQNMRYQLLSMYVVVLAGNIWFQIENQLNGKGDTVLDVVRDSLPKAGVYFITLVMFYTGVLLPMNLLRPWDICTYICPRRGKPSYVDWYPALEVTVPAIVFIYGLLYAFIAPAILPVCAAYFGWAALVYRFLFRYVYQPDFDMGGTFWYDLFNSVLLGCTLGCACLTGSIAVYLGFGWHFWLSCLLSVIVFLSQRGVAKGFLQEAGNMSLENASFIDSASRDLAEKYLNEDYYSDPCVVAHVETPRHSFRQTEAIIPEGAEGGGFVSAAEAMETEMQRAAASRQAAPDGPVSFFA